jgi:hypothetical protein
MIELSVPQPPLEMQEWAAPVDDDLYYISLASYRYCQLMDALANNGYKIRQATQSDIDSAGASLTTVMDSVLSALYPGGE